MPPKRYNKAGSSYGNNNYKKYKAESPEPALMYSQGDTVIELGSKKRVTVRSFKGIPLVDIREFYTINDSVSGEPVTLPGKKGISLSLQLWEQLLERKDEINNALNRIQGKPALPFASVSAATAATTGANTTSKNRPTSSVSAEHIPTQLTPRVKVVPEINGSIQLPDAVVVKQEEGIKSEVTGDDDNESDEDEEEDKDEEEDEDDAALELELGELLDEESDSEA